MTVNRQNRIRLAWRLFEPASIALLVAIIFGDTAYGEFLSFDDEYWIVRNCTIQQPSIKTALWIFSPGAYLYYQPVTFLSWMIDYAVGGLDPFVYHLHNVVLYALGGYLFFLFLLELFDTFGVFKARHRRVAVLAAAWLFLLHPAHVESVAWATERKDMLALVFGSASLLIFLRMLRSSTRFFLKSPHWWAALALFAAAILSKGYMAVFAGVFLALELSVRRFKGRVAIGPLLGHAPFFLIAMLAIIFYSSINRALVPLQDDFSTYGVPDRIVLWFRYVGEYVLALVWPFDLVNIYVIGERQFQFGWQAALGASAATAAVILLAWSWIAKRLPLFFLFCLAIIYLLPGTGILPLNWSARYLLFPAAIPAIFIVWAAYAAGSRLERLGRPALAALPLLAAGFMGVVLAGECRVRTGVWHDSASFFLDSLRQHKDSDSIALEAAIALKEKNPELGWRIIAPILEKPYAKSIENVRLLEIELRRRLHGPQKAFEAAEESAGTIVTSWPLANNAAWLAMELGETDAAETWLGIGKARLPEGESEDTICDFWVEWGKKAIVKAEYDKALGLLSKCPQTGVFSKQEILRIVAAGAKKNDLENAVARLEGGDCPIESEPLRWESLYLTYKQLGREASARRAREIWERKKDELAFHKCWSDKALREYY